MRTQEVERVRRQWDALGRKDPLWAVLTLEDKRGGRWDPDEFFATGRDEIDSVVTQAAQLGLPLGRRRALDFGCGVGRLTQALVPHFHEVEGVDISPPMLEQARRFNRAPQKCRYTLNQSRDLRIYDDASFSLVYSHLVLQHLAPEASRGYLREFLRVLEPGGLIVCQVPSHRHPGEPDPGAARSPASGPLPEAAFRAGIELAEPSLSAAPGARIFTKLEVRNLGGAAWPCGGVGSGPNPVQVGGRWRNARGDFVNADELRAPLPADVPPGGRASLFLQVRVPDQPGRHLLEVDVVQEGVAWFSDRGSRAAWMEVIAGATDAGPVREARAPFRERHPVPHRLLSGLGVVRAVAFLRRLRRSWSRRGIAELLPQAADMDMHAIPKADMRALLEAAGGIVLRCEPIEMLRSAWQTYRYWVTRQDEALPLPPPTAWRRPLAATIESISVAGPLRVGAGTHASLRLRLTNEGGVSWPLVAEPRPGAIVLGAHAYRDGQLVSFDYLRQALPGEVRPGETADLDCAFDAPAEPGSYTLRFDLVLEGVCWFEIHGTRPLEVPLAVL